MLSARSGAAKVVFTMNVCGNAIAVIAIGFMTFSLIFFDHLEFGKKFQNR